MSGGQRRRGFQTTSLSSDLLHPASPTSQSSRRETLTNQSGPSFSNRLQGSSSQPTTPTQRRKYISHDAPGQQAGSSFRFRVVRLSEVEASSGGRGKSHQRGRWMCTDFRLGAELRQDRRRNAHSLDSLDMIGWDKDKDGAVPKDVSLTLASSGGGVKGAELVSRGGPPTPSHQDPTHLVSQRQPIRVQSLKVNTPPCPQNLPRPLRLQEDARGQPVFRTSLSSTSSPPYGPLHPSLTPSCPPSVSSLDRTTSSLQVDTSSPAIDSKIEEAMDLVKNHLVLAVREEVDLLREQIMVLQEKNRQLERENHVLRTSNSSLTTTSGGPSSSWRDNWTPEHPWRT